MGTCCSNEEEVIVDSEHYTKFEDNIIVPSAPPYSPVYSPVYSNYTPPSHGTIVYRR